jgi:hypothetical protein
MTRNTKILYVFLLFFFESVPPISIPDVRFRSLHKPLETAKTIHKILVGDLIILLDLKIQLHLTKVI